VLFAAGNCGAACPDGRCGADNGPAKDIWGANGHPRVMTVGAVNVNGQYVGYSSAGPAALDPNKPDFCGITHFAGYFPTIDPGGPSDGGTSAATPIIAGVVALFKQKKAALTQDQVKTALKATAKDIGAAGWDQFAGAGIVQAKAAWDKLFGLKMKFADDPHTVKYFDDHPTLKFSDDPSTIKSLDDHVTLKFQDDAGTLKTLDDHITLKAADDITLPSSGEPAARAAAAAGASPFVLSTPHHSMAWMGLAGGQEQPQSYEAALAQMQQALEQLEQTMLQLNSQLQALDQEYRQMLEQYSALVEEYKRAASAEQTE